MAPASSKSLDYEGMGNVSLLHFHLGQPPYFPKLGLGSFFHLRSFPLFGEGSGVRASSGGSSFKVSALKPAVPSRVPPAITSGPSTLILPGVPGPSGESSAPRVGGQVHRASRFPSPFPPRYDTWMGGLRAEGLDRDVADLITQSNKPSTRRQFESGWSQFGGYCEKNHLRPEDVSPSTVVNFLGRQFLDDGLATNTVLNHLYAIKKPFEAMFHVSLSGHENLADLTSAMRKVRPPQVGARVFPKWSLQGLLRYLNSEVFEPLDTAPFDRVRSKLLTLICLNTGRRVGEVAAIEGFSNVRDGIKFSWPTGFLAKMEGRIPNWTAQPPSIFPIDAPDKRLCPVRAFRRYLEFPEPNDRNRNSERLWLLLKSQVSCLVRNNIKASLAYAPHGLVGGSRSPPKVTVHDLRKFACSYSRKYLPGSKSALAKRVGSRTFTVLDRTYIRDVPRVEATFQVPLGTIMPTTTEIRSLRVD